MRISHIGVKKRVGTFASGILGPSTGVPGSGPGMSKLSREAREATDVRGSSEPLLLKTAPGLSPSAGKIRACGSSETPLLGVENSEPGCIF